MRASKRRNLFPQRRRPRWLALAAAASLGLIAGTSAAKPLTLVYPQAASDSDSRSEYALDLLRLALRHDGIDARLQPTREPMTQQRAVVQLSQGRDIDVIWTMTSRKRERLLRPIRIPLAKGLAGWRVFLIRKGDQPQFDSVHNLQDLAAMKAGQARDWPDTRILRANGLSVYAAPRYRGLFAMLQYGHIDYFPRTVREARVELKAHAALGLAIERHLALHYKSAFYFFVAPDNALLAKRITAGLRAAMADGSLDRLFEKHFRAALEAANLDNRLVLELKNPVLPDGFSARSGTLWHRALSGR